MGSRTVGLYVCSAIRHSEVWVQLPTAMMGSFSAMHWPWSARELILPGGIEADRG